MSISAVIPNLNSGPCSTAASTPLPPRPMSTRSWSSTRDRRTAATSERRNGQRVRVISAPRDHHPGAAEPESRRGTQRIRPAAQQRRIRRPADAWEARGSAGTAPEWPRAGHSSDSRTAPHRSPPTVQDAASASLSLRSGRPQVSPGAPELPPQSQTASSRSRGCRCAARRSPLRLARDRRLGRAVHVLLRGSGLLPPPRRGRLGPGDQMGRRRDPRRWRLDEHLERANPRQWFVRLPGEPVPLPAEVAPATAGGSSASSGLVAPGCTSCSGTCVLFACACGRPRRCPPRPSVGAGVPTRRAAMNRVPLRRVLLPVRPPDAIGSSFTAPGSRATTTSVTRGCCRGLGVSMPACWSAPTVGWCAESSFGP